MGLTWRGDSIVRRIEAAARTETVGVVDDAVEDARADTPVLTGAARDSLRRENEGLAVRWGYHVLHGFFIEVGARGKAGVYAMRRAGDRRYADLAGRIARRWRA